MPENYDHYITKNIKALYKRRLFSPIVYLIIVIVLWHVFSLTDLLFPVQLTDDVTLESAYRNDAANMHTTLTDLKFTGYTRNNFSGTSGYYYYTIRNDECIIVLLSPSTCEEGLPFIDEVTFTGKIKKSTVSFQSLLKNMSDDLGWTESGITFTEMRSSRSTRSYGFISTPHSISFSGIISVFPTHCISVPTSICISSARRI